MNRLFAIAAAACLAASDAGAQSRTTEAQARSYLLSGFMTGAAHALLSPGVELAPELRAKLALPGEAQRDRIYEALIGLTHGKAIRIRLSTPDEAAHVASPVGHPVFVLQAGALRLLLAYDLQRDEVSFVGALPVALVETPKLSRWPDPFPSTPFLLRPIVFAHGVAALSEAAVSRLQEAGLPKIAPVHGVRYVVRGHSDRLEFAQFKGRLSEQRAAAVRDYLEGQGVPAPNIRSVGFGTAVSLTTCAQKDRDVLITCLAPDRRVTVEILPPPR